MSTFEVKVVKVDSVEKHPDADRLTIVSIAGYKCISNLKDDGTWRYNAGDLVVYIPESAVLPEWLLKKMGFWKEEENKGTLAGSKGDRVKAIRLRGIFSQGILYPVNVMIDNSQHTIKTDTSEIFVKDGSDVANDLGITKYEPPVPVHMTGEVASAPSVTLKYDIENLQKYTRVFEEGEEVVVTEKLHGTWACLAYVPGLNNPELLYGDYFATSKGMSGAGRFFKNNEANANNLYHKQLLSEIDFLEQKIKMVDILGRISSSYESIPVYVLGEIFGAGVQDLTYGASKPVFRVFDIYVGTPTQGRYLNDAELEKIVAGNALTRVPVLYRGPYSMEKMVELRDGNTKFAEVKQIREGIVIKTTIERENKWIGRVQLKFVSPDYLLRKGNATEFQ